MMTTVLVSLFFSFLLSMLLISCTHKPYHPEKTEKEWIIDHEDCEKWAREGIRDQPDTYDAMDEINMSKSCMKKKGWSWRRTGLFDVNNEENE